jgi:hypothetical protein
MLTWFKDEMEKLGNVVKREISPYNIINGATTHYKINAYEVEGIGTFSTIKVNALVSTVKVESIIFTPLYKDMPLLSFDFISVIGWGDTLLLELYDTNINPQDLSSLVKIKENSSLPDGTLNPRWFDKIKMSPSLVKKARKKKKELIDFSKEYILEFIRLLNEVPSTTKEEKQAKVQVLADDLFNKGSRITDQLKKLIGDKPTYDLLTHYILGANTSAK